MESASPDDIFLALPLLVFGVFVVMQGSALLWLSGRWRSAAFVPLLAMGAAISIAVLGVLAGSNMAPIWVVLAMPLCLLWLAALWLLRGIAALAGH